MTDHRRSGGRGWLAVVLAVLLIGSGLVAWMWTSRSAVPAPGPTGTESPAPPQQQTLLVQVRDDEAVAVNDTLMSSADPRGRSSLLLVPARMLVDVTGPVPELPFGQTARLPVPDASQTALADLLGARVDGGWVLDRLAFAGLVDAVGGVQIVVPEVLVVTDEDGVVTYTFPKGTQKLDGPEAAAYVQFLAPGAPEESRLARFSAVWRQVVLRLPPDRDRVVAILGSLGALSRSSIPTVELASFLLAWRADLNLGRVDQRDLPVRPSETLASTSTRLEFRAARPIVEQLLAGALRVPAPDQPVRVLLEDVTGSAARIAAARDEIRTAGQIPLTGGKTPVRGVTASRVLVPPGLPDAPARGRQVAEALRLPSADVVVTDEGRTVADVTVVLGRDYVPAGPTPPASPAAGTSTGPAAAASRTPSGAASGTS